MSTAESTTRSGAVPTAEDLADEVRIHARSISIGSDRLKAIARIDLLESEDGYVTPVDYKRGKPPDIPERAWEPERVQLCIQGLLLRDNGYNCEEGIIYFAQSHERVNVSFTPELIARTLELLEEARATAESGKIRLPLLIHQNVHAARWSASVCRMRRPLILGHGLHA